MKDSETKECTEECNYNREKELNFSKCDCHCHATPPETPSWEEEFDKDFIKDNGNNIEPSFKDPNGDVGPVKLFIRNLASSEYKRGYNKGRTDGIIWVAEQK